MQSIIKAASTLVAVSSGGLSYLCRELSDPNNSVYAVNEQAYKQCGTKCSCLSIETLCFTEIKGTTEKSYWRFGAVPQSYAKQCNICVCNIYSSPQKW